jgi:4-carboxymuconolactone decarboxylase
MTRFKPLKREEMNDEQGRAFDDIKAAGGPTAGPYWAYVRQPRLMRLLHDSSACLRDSDMTARERQIIILTTIRHWGAHYPWAVQVRGSLAAGVDQHIIDAINARKEPDLTDRRERAAWRVATELLANKGLSDKTYAEAEAAFGLETLVAVVVQVGSFCITCCTANAFDITPPDDVPHRLAG